MIKLAGISLFLSLYLFGSDSELDIRKDTPTEKILESLKQQFGRDDLVGYQKENNFIINSIENLFVLTPNLLFLHHLI